MSSRGSKHVMTSSYYVTGLHQHHLQSQSRGREGAHVALSTWLRHVISSRDLYQHHLQRQSRGGEWAHMALSSTWLRHVTSWAHVALSTWLRHVTSINNILSSKPRCREWALVALSSWYCHVTLRKYGRYRNYRTSYGFKHVISVCNVALDAFLRYVPRLFWGYTTCPCTVRTFKAEGKNCVILTL